MLRLPQKIGWLDLKIFRFIYCLFELMASILLSKFGTTVLIQLERFIIFYIIFYMLSAIEF